MMVLFWIMVAAIYLWVARDFIRRFLQP
jgi:hypothetical protein